MVKVEVEDVLPKFPISYHQCSKKMDFTYIHTYIIHVTNI